MVFANLNAGISIHQVALSDALYKILGDDYVFIEFGSKDEGQFGSFEGVSEGVDFYKDRPYILKMYESEENTQRAKELIANADVLRTGGEPFEMVKQRILNGKLTFRSSERFFKGPMWKDLIRFARVYSHYSTLSHLNYRMLCQSAYLPNDMRYFSKGYRDKCYKFAYFTQIPQIDIEEIIQSRSKDKLKLVWCARFINWKHPEMMLTLAKNLIKSGRSNFEINMIGANTTALWKNINDQVNKEKLGGYIHLIGGVPNAEVLMTMRNSHVHVSTSDRGEGWGAVLNEAMGAGCACVASNEIGASPFLLKNKENGLFFKSRSAESLFEKVAYLYDNRQKNDEFGRKAYNTITNKWSAEFAAERLVYLSESILNRDEIYYEEGPCSKAYSITPNSLL